MRYKLWYHHPENQDIPRNLYKIAWGQLMEIWLQKPMMNTSLINMGTLTPNGAAGDIFKLKRVAQMFLVSQTKTRHAQNFWRSYPFFKCLPSPTELSQYIHDQESLVPPHPLYGANYTSESFPVLCPRTSPCPSNLPSKQKPAVLSLHSTTYLHAFIFTPTYFSY